MIYLNGYIERGQESTFGLQIILYHRVRLPLWIAQKRLVIKIISMVTNVPYDRLVRDQSAKLNSRQIWELLIEVQCIKRLKWCHVKIICKFRNRTLVSSPNNIL